MSLVWYGKTIVGENGAGKSTLIKLLSGLYRPQQGSVMLDDCVVQAPDHRISIVFQDFWRPALRLREAVGIARLDKLDDNAHLMEAIRHSGALSIVDAHRLNLDSYLTREFEEGGVELSGGEWQRICLARAFMNPETSLILLDEPSSAISPIEEVSLYREIVSHFEGRTMIIVSHRLGITRLVDRILVMKSGCILEDGDHDTLVSKEAGEYRRMFEEVSSLYNHDSTAKTPSSK